MGDKQTPGGGDVICLVFLWGFSGQIYGKHWTISSEKWDLVDIYGDITISNHFPIIVLGNMILW